MTELTDLSETDASNTTITTADISEGCAPSGINNALRNTLGLIRRAFKTSIFRLRDSTDQTKLVAFDLSALTAGATRKITMPDEDVALGQSYYKQCKLTYVDTGNIRLVASNGNKLTINGVQEAVPSAGVTLAVSGLTAGTLYFIYAYMNSGTMTLEASETVRATSTTTGMEIKTGDETRALVGMVYPVTGPAFAYSNSQRLVRSWYGNVPIGGTKTWTGSTGSTSNTESASTDRIEYLAWNAEVYAANVMANAANSGNRSRLQLYRSGSALGPLATVDHLSATNNIHNLSSAASGIVSGDGYYYVSPFISTSAGTSSYTDGVANVVIS